MRADAWVWVAWGLDLAMYGVFSLRVPWGKSQGCGVSRSDMAWAGKRKTPDPPRVGGLVKLECDGLREEVLLNRHLFAWWPW